MNETEFTMEYFFMIKKQIHIYTYHSRFIPEGVAVQSTRPHFTKIT
jgi:hypothetical protein